MYVSTRYCILIMYVQFNTISGIFYFTLGNLPPKFRSKLSFYLVAIAKQKYVTKYGMDAFLQLFVQDMKKLVSLLNVDLYIIIIFYFFV